MDEITHYFTDLQVKAHQAQNKNALKFISQKGTAMVKEYNVPSINPRLRKKALTQNRILSKIIAKRNKEISK